MSSVPPPAGQAGWDELDPRSHFAQLAYYNHKTDFMRAAEGSDSFIHEMIHFADHVGTPYGYFLDRISTLRNGAYRQVLALFNAQTAPRLPVPLARWLSGDMIELEQLIRAEASGDYDVEACLDYLIVLAAIWPGITVLERALEGLSSPGPFPIDLDSAIGGLMVIEALEREGRSSLPADVWDFKSIAMDDRPWTPADVIPHMHTEAGEHVPLGAAALLETRAFFLERGLTTTDPLPAQVARSGGAYYWPLVALVNEGQSCGIDDIQELTDTFQALADLSFYTPIGSPYGKLRKTNRWNDIHPGHRFVQLIRRVKEVGPLKRSKEIDIFDYQDRYCLALEWASPREFLRLGSQLEAVDFRSRRHREACKMKLSHPRYFINANLTYLDLPDDETMFAWMNDYMPFVVNTFNPGRVMVGKQSTEIYLERLKVAYLQSLGWSLLMAAKQAARPHLDPDFPYASLLRWPSDGSLSSYFDSSTRPHVRLAEI
jgi:hypothetical protein